MSSLRPAVISMCKSPNSYQGKLIRWNKEQKEKEDNPEKNDMELVDGADSELCPFKSTKSVIIQVLIYRKK